MNHKIGVLKDKEGNITDIAGMTYINIYEKNYEWEIADTIKELKADTSSISALRGFLKEMMNRLDDCRILVGTSITGIPYQELDSNGVILCEAEEFGFKLLEEIYKDYCIPKEEEKKEEEPAACYPWPVDHDGNFFFDFIAAQKSRPEISSKKALLPFLSHELFQTLTILCDHVMPWLEGFAADRELDMSVKREDRKYLVVITQRS